MKKTLFVVPVLAALFLAGCTKVENFSARESCGNEIGFATYTGRALTKSTGTDLNQSFYVESFLSKIPSGALTRTIYFPSTKYTYNSGHYTGEITRVWPLTGNLDFYAVSPLQYKNTLAADADLALAADTTFTVTKTDGTADIVAARLVNVTNGTDPVKLTFGHKLTKVAFKAIGADQAKKYVIKDVILTANSSAAYQFGATESWGTSADAYGYSYLSSDVEIPASTSAAVSLGTAKYLIPSQGSSVTALVKYEIYEGDNLVDDNTAGVSVNLPTTGIWGINKSVVYTLTLNFSSSVKVIHFSAEVDDWDEDTTVAVPWDHYVDEGIDYGAGIRIGDDIWAPVNCGYDPYNYPYGKLYQWGRKYPCEYNNSYTDNTGTHPAENVLQTNQATLGSVSADDEDPSVFYNVSSTLPIQDWLNPQDSTRWNSAPYPNSAGQKGDITPIKTVNDPCPSGWRVPTFFEMEALRGSVTDVTVANGSHGCSTVLGFKFDGADGSSTTDFVFLPAGGFRRAVGLATSRGTVGDYSTSSQNEAGTTGKNFLISSTASMSGCARANALTVRCILEQ